jgi:transcription-repair coupling factor (superfamily II helicase)
VSRFSLTAQLEQASASAADVVRALRGTQPRVDLAGTPPGCLAYVLARAADSAHPVLLVTADAKRAQRLEADLRFFAGGASVLSYPGADTTPFVDVAPDRRAAMDRLASLFQLAEGLPLSVVVAPLGVLVRRVPPRAALRSRSARVRVGDELDRQAFLRALAEGGYLRVPLVEDPGSFAVRGALLDVFCPREERPVRIELDGDEVVSLKQFDAEDQRTLGGLDELAVHPVREILLGPEELARARQRVADLCDERNLPTSRRRQLVEDLASGRSFVGLECFLPAFYERLESVLDYLPASARVVVDDPLSVARALDSPRRSTSRRSR